MCEARTVKRKWMPFDQIKRIPAHIMLQHATTAPEYALDRVHSKYGYLHMNTDIYYEIL